MSEIGYTASKTAVGLLITYRCDLACQDCNRGGFISESWRPPDMTMDDVAGFFEQARRDMPGLRTVCFLGGEPTLHSQCLEMIRLAESYQVYFPGLRLFILSNGYSRRAQEILAHLSATGLAHVDYANTKTSGYVNPRWTRTIFVSPRDLGMDREPCNSHSSKGYCGFGVDSLGMTVCDLGGMVDSILRLGARTPRLADLFDEKFAEKQTRRLCEHCGANMDSKIGLTQRPGLHAYGQSRLSETWHKAIEFFRETI